MTWCDHTTATRTTTRMKMRSITTGPRFVRFGFRDWISIRPSSYRDRRPSYPTPPSYLVLSERIRSTLHSDRHHPYFYLHLCLDAQPTIDHRSSTVEIKRRRLILTGRRKPKRKHVWTSNSAVRKLWPALRIDDQVKSRSVRSLTMLKQRKTIRSDRIKARIAFEYPTFAYCVQ
jgi:hypothetical protein